MSRPRFLRSQSVRGFVPMTDSQEAIASEIFPNWSNEQLTTSELEKIFAIDKEREDKKNAFIEQARTYPLILIEKCPKCYLKEMNVYKINELGYFCECRYCNASGSAKDYRTVLNKLNESIWEQE